MNETRTIAKDRPNGETPRAGGRREPLTRERIVSAALRIMDEGGLEAVTMRRVGRELGVEAMSLYNHVPDKQDILDGVAEAVMAGFEWEPTSEDWLIQARRAASEWRRMLRRHPNVITVLVERKHPLMSVEALRPMEIALDILIRAGLSERDAVQAYQAIGAYIFGFVMMEVGFLTPGSAGPAEGLSPEEMARRMPPELPCFGRLLPWFATCDLDATFDLGLELLLEGIRARSGQQGP